MAGVANNAVGKVVQLLIDPSQLSSNIAQISESQSIALTPIPAAQIVTGNISFEIAERSGETKYSSVYVYCDKISNVLKEKFRSFSGKVHLVVEVRVSQDRLDALEDKLQLYVEAITQVLNQSRGDWNQGLFYSGGYEVAFGAVKHGGRNFIKIAKVSFEVDASVN